MSTPTEYYERYRPVGSLPPYLLHLFDAHVTPSARCLDLGCGDGRTAGLWLSGHAAAYVGVDISTREPWRDPHIRFFTPKTLRRMLEQHVGFVGVETRGVAGSFLAELPGARRFVGSEASALYRALVRAAPTLFGARIHAAARKPGGIA